MASYLMGIDVGTTGTKAMVIDWEGNIVGAGYREYPCLYPKPNWVEQDAELVIESTFEACKGAVESSEVNPGDIVSLGFSVQRATFALLDENKKVIGGNFYGWQDNRAATELEYITSKMSPKELYNIAGMPVTPTFSLEKIVWIMRNDRERYDQAKHIALMSDYVMYRFGVDDIYGEVTNACCSGMIDLKKLEWSEKILDVYGIDQRKLPKLIKPGTKVGKLSKEVSEKTGLSEGTPLCTGTGDQQCAAIGAGVVKDGKASLTLGTAGLLVVGVNEPVFEENRGLMVCASGAYGLYELEGIQLGAASSYKWICDLVGNLEKTLSAEINLDFYNLIDYHVQKSPVGSNGIVFMPFLSGSGYPYWNSEAKGLFAGLKFSHTKGDMIRSVMEGITLESKDMYETMKKTGVVIKSLAITGGATKSATWRQVIADMFNVEIKRLKVPDATIVGAAILAGVGVGVFGDAVEGVKKLVKYTGAIKPIPENAEKYDKVYEVYKNMYNVFNENRVYAQLSDIIK